MNILEKEQFNKDCKIVENELKAYSKLKEIIKDKIEKLNKHIDEMDKKIEENENAFADEDFKDDYNYCEDQLLAFDFVLKTMDELEKEVLEDE